MFEVKFSVAGAELTPGEADKLMKPRRFFDQEVAREQAQRTVESVPNVTAAVVESAPSEEETSEANARAAVAELAVKMNMSVGEQQVMIANLRQKRRSVRRAAEKKAAQKELDAMQALPEPVVSP